MTAQRIAVLHESDVGEVRRRARDLARRERLPSTVVEALATAVSEIARNIVVHAGVGDVTLQVIDSPAYERRLVIVARDWGPGILDVERALEDGYSSSGSLGVGLGGARRMVDEFEIASSAGGGTTITMVKWIAERA